MSKYEVKVLEKGGTCETDLFEKMVKNGDITAVSVKEFIGQMLTISGYSLCEITTEDKQFKIGYYDTEEYGMISTGSEIFLKSVKEYFGEVDKVRIMEIKTKQGKTFKAVPVLKKENKKEETKTSEEENAINNDDLPF